MVKVFILHEVNSVLTRITFYYYKELLLGEYRCLFFLYEFFKYCNPGVFNVQNVFERGLSSLLYCGKDTAVCY